MAVLAGHRAEVQAVGFSPDSRLMATGSTDGGVILWDVTDPAQPATTATLTARYRRRRPISRCALEFSPDGRLMAIGTATADVILWDVTQPARPAQTATLTVIPSRWQTAKHTVAFSPAGRLLATGSGRRDRCVFLWDVTRPAHPVRTATLIVGGGRPRARAAHAVGFSPDGRLLATGSGNGRAMLWDVTDPAHPVGTAPLELHRRHSSRAEPTVYSVAFSPTGRLLAVCSHLPNTAAAYGDYVDVRNDAVSEVSLWDATEPAHPARTATLSHRDAGTPEGGSDPTVYALGFSPDGRLLATGGDTAVALWDVTDPAHPAWTETGLDERGVRALGFSPDGRLLAIGGGTSVALWRRPP